MKIKFTLTFCLFFFSICSFAQDDDSDDTVTAPAFTTIRLGLHTQSDFYREVLLGFMNQNATEGLDTGYDAVNANDFDNDMYFLCGTSKLLIQGVGYYLNTNIYPIGVTSTVSGIITFNLDEALNWNPGENMYIYDALTNTYNDLRENDFEVEVEAGTFNDRFSLRFQNPSTTLGLNSISQVENINMFYSNINQQLVINNTTTNNSLSVNVFNLSGQQVLTKKIESQNKKNIEIPLSNLSTGTYIVKLSTTNGVINKKIIIN